MPITTAAPLILASSSRYRAELLQRLGIAFEVRPSGLDETPAGDETPAELAAQLATGKARSVAKNHPERWVLGSDQVCACAGQILGKPGSRALALAQLRWLSGREATFFTAVALLHDAAPAASALDVTRVQFRTLEEAEIERYVAAEPSFDCAGSFKAEGLGITLCDAIDSRDPTALVGLPLIATARLLRKAGIALP